MGFVKPKMSAPAGYNAPPVVTENTESDVRNNYEQTAARRRGLLSTILSNRRQAESSSAAEGNGTLG